jgi:hypothetical protein
MISELIPFGLGDVEGWSDVEELIEAVHAMTDGLFRHANQALQRGPVPGGIAEKLIILDYGASAVLKRYQEMGALARYAFVESAIRHFALKTRGWAARYAWPAAVAKFVILLSPAQVRLAQQHADIFEPYRFWSESPMTAAECRRLHGEFASHVLMLIMQQGNETGRGMRVGQVRFLPQPWAVAFPGYDY